MVPPIHTVVSMEKLENVRSGGDNISTVTESKHPFVLAA